MPASPEPAVSAVDGLLAVIRQRLDRFRATGDPAVILAEEAGTEAGALWQATFGARGSGPAVVVQTLGLLCLYRHSVLPNGPDKVELERAVNLFGELVGSHPDLVPGELWPVLSERVDVADADPVVLLNVAIGLLRPPAGGPDVASIDRAVGLLRRAVGCVPPGRPLRVVVLNSLSVALTERYEATGRLRDQDEAIAVARESVASLGDDDPSLAMQLSNLGVALRNRFHRTRAVRDLDDAVAAGEVAVGLAGTVGDEAMYRAMLGLTLRARGLHNHAVADLDRAVEVLRSAVAATDLYSRPYAIRISNLTSVLNSRFEVRGDSADLDAAVTAVRSWLDLLDTSDPAWPEALALYATTLESRYAATGDVRDLDAAVGACRDAVTTQPSASSLYTLETLLRARFHRHQGPADLDEAIAAGERALRLLPEASPTRAGLLSHLCSSYRERFYLSKNPADLDAAVASGRQAVATPALRQNDDLNHLSNFAGALHATYDHSGERRHLDESIDTLRRAIDRTPAGHPYLPSRLTNLANALLAWWSDLRATRDLDEALTLARTAAADGGTAGVQDYRPVLGAALLARFEERGEAADADAAIDAWQATAREPVTPPVVRLRAARGWGVVAGRLGAWTRALDGYLAAASVLPLAAWHGVDRSGRERLLVEEARHLGTDAAAAALYVGHSDTAVELLEQTRGVLWAQILDTREDFIRLSQVDGRLGEELERVRSAMRDLDEQATVPN